MQKLIEVSALLEEIAHGKSKPEICDGADQVDWMERCIENAPSIDAQPIRHGKWTFAFMDETYGEVYVCSHCAEIGYPEARYCPNCGAKMDEVSKP